MSDPYLFFPDDPRSLQAWRHKLNLILIGCCSGLLLLLFHIALTCSHFCWLDYSIITSLYLPCIPCLLPAIACWNGVNFRLFTAALCVATLSPFLTWLSLSADSSKNLSHIWFWFCGRILFLPMLTWLCHELFKCYSAILTRLQDAATLKLLKHVHGYFTFFSLWIYLYPFMEMDMRHEYNPVFTSIRLFLFLLTICSILLATLLTRRGLNRMTTMTLEPFPCHQSRSLESPASESAEKAGTSSAAEFRP